MFEILKMRLRNGLFRPKAFSMALLKPPERGQVEPCRIEKMEKATRKSLSRSLLIRHLDTGSCNAEEAELMALSGPFYDMSRYGFEFTVSPRHADILTVSGPVTRHLVVAMQRTYEAMPHPKIVVAIGDGACTGAPYGNTYACLGSVDQFLLVDVYIPGDPPSPTAILEGLLQCKQILLEINDRK